MLKGVCSRMVVCGCGYSRSVLNAPDSPAVTVCRASLLAASKPEALCSWSLLLLSLSSPVGASFFGEARSFTVLGSSTLLAPLSVSGCAPLRFTSSECLKLFKACSCPRLSAMVVMLLTVGNEAAPGCSLLAPRVPMAPPCARSQPRTFSVSTALATTFVGFAAAAFVAAAGAGTASVVEAARWSQFWMPAPPSCLAKLSASTPFSAMRCNASALICSSLQPGATATPCDRSHLATVSEHSFPSPAAASGAFVVAVGKLCSQALSTSAWVPVFCATEATDRSASTMYCFVRAFTSSSLHVPSKSCGTVFSALVPSGLSLPDSPPADPGVAALLLAPALLACSSAGAGPGVDTCSLLAALLAVSVGLWGVASFAFAFSASSASFLVTCLLCFGQNARSSTSSMFPERLLTSMRSICFFAHSGWNAMAHCPKEHWMQAPVRSLHRQHTRRHRSLLIPLMFSMGSMVSRLETKVSGIHCEQNRCAHCRPGSSGGMGGRLSATAVDGPGAAVGAGVAGCGCVCGCCSAVAAPAGGGCGRACSCSPCPCDSAGCCFCCCSSTRWRALKAAMAAW
mmetsp:Transcript_8530/g.31513  ORF Transcript_8530/g.31513 Transcript_8530/m.31513 type:complete len:569 (-) Transcript_8530:1092-2798(-)